MDNGVLVREICKLDTPDDILFFPEATGADIIYTEQGHAYIELKPLAFFKYYLWKWADFRATYDCNFKLPIPGCAIEDVWLEV